MRTSSGRALVHGLRSGPAERPPFIPLLGEYAQAVTQTTAGSFSADSQVYTRCVLETATALRADAVTVGFGVAAEVGVEAVHRLAPLLGGRGLVAYVGGATVATVRGYCEAGVDMVIVPWADLAERLKTLTRVCRFYEVPCLAHDLSVTACDPVLTSLDGVIVAAPSGHEPGIVGGGLSPETLEAVVSPAPDQPFFWTFPGEVPPDASPEALAALGARLAEGPRRTDRRTGGSAGRGAAHSVPGARGTTA